MSVFINSQKKYVRAEETECVATKREGGALTGGRRDRPWMGGGGSSRGQAGALCEYTTG